MLFGRRLRKLAENGDSKRILHILEKGAFGVEKYNESYLSFAECQHRKEGLEILIAAHERFPTDAVSILVQTSLPWEVQIVHLAVLLTYLVLNIAWA